MALKIKVGADISEAVAAAKKLQSSVGGAADGISAAFARISNLDFSKQFEEASARINASVDAAVNAALGLGNSFDTAVGISVKSLDQLEEELDQLARKINSSTSIAGIEKLAQEYRDLERQIRNLKVVSGLTTNFDRAGVAAKGAAANVAKVTPSSNAAFGALTGLNRIVQDSAYGFNGIANNITELPVLFRQLSVAAKETNTSMSRLLLQSLLGAGGIGTALSLITTGLTFATVGFGAWTRGISGSGDAAKKATKDIDGLNDAIESAVSSAAEDAARITKLYNALSSNQLNTQQRKKALEELQDANFEFFGALKEEKGLIIGLQQAYEGYLAKLLDIGRAKAVEAQLAKLFDKKLELELSVDTKFITATSADAQKRIGLLQQELKKLGGPLTDEEQRANIYQKGNEKLAERFKLQAKISEIERGGNVFFGGDGKDQLALRKTRFEIEQLTRQIEGLSKLQRDIGNFGIDPDKDKKGRQKNEKTPLELEIERLKKQIGDLEELKKLGGFLTKDEILLADLKVKLAISENLQDNTLNAGQLQRKIDQIIQSADIRADIPVALNLAKQLPKIDTGQIKPPPVAVDLNFNIDKSLSLAKIQAAKVAEELNKAIKDRLTQLTGDLAEQIGNLIGAAISGNDLGGILQGFVGVFADAMIQLGKTAIATGIAIKGLKEAFKSLNPGVAIAAGVALVGLGSAVKASVAKIPRFAEGGLVTGPQLAMVGDNPSGKEAIIPFEKMGQFLNQFGSGNQVVVMETVVRGEDLYLVQKRQERKYNRLF